jgi:hypothetical protein
MNAFMIKHYMLIEENIIKSTTWCQYFKYIHINQVFQLSNYLKDGIVHPFVQ